MLLSGSAIGPPVDDNGGNSTLIGVGTRSCAPEFDCDGRSSSSRTKPRGFATPNLLLLALMIKLPSSQIDHNPADRCRCIWLCSYAVVAIVRQLPWSSTRFAFCFFMTYFRSVNGATRWKRVPLAAKLTDRYCTVKGMEEKSVSRLCMDCSSRLTTLTYPKKGGGSAPAKMSKTAGWLLARSPRLWHCVNMSLYECWNFTPWQVGIIPISSSLLHYHTSLVANLILERSIRFSILPFLYSSDM